LAHLVQTTSLGPSPVAPESGMAFLSMHSKTVILSPRVLCPSSCSACPTHLPRLHLPRDPTARTTSPGFFSSRRLQQESVLTIWPMYAIPGHAFKTIEGFGSVDPDNAEPARPPCYHRGLNFPSRITVSRSRGTTWENRPVRQEALDEKSKSTTRPRHQHPFDPCPSLMRPAGHLRELIFLS